MMLKGQLQIGFCQSLKDKEEVKKRWVSNGDHNSRKEVFWSDVDIPYRGHSDGYMIKVYTLEKDEFGL